MATAEAIHQFLAGAEALGDPYRMAAAAGALLAADPRDSLARGHYRRALGALKLTAAIERLAGEGAGRQERAEKSGGGLIPWSSRARRFAANLRALETRTREGAGRVSAAAKELEPYQLYQCGDGNYQVSDSRLAVNASWLGGLANHKAATGLWKFDRAKTPMPPALAFDGLGFGWLALHVLETTRRSFLNYSCAGYVLEPDPVSLAMLFHMHDLQAAIGEGDAGEGKGRLRWLIAGEQARVLEDFRQRLELNESWCLPLHFVRGALRPRAALDIDPVIQAVRQKREARLQAHLQEIERHYEGKDAAYWKRRFAAALGGGDNGDPLRILGITSRYTTVLQHSMRELQAAAEHLATAGNAAGEHGGKRRLIMEIAIEPDDHSLQNPFVEKIAAMRPDLIVQISRMRYENPHLPRNVPFLTWDQDNLPCMRTPQATASLDALTFVAGHGALHGYVYQGWPARNVILCHLAAATHRYQPRALAPDEMERYGCDVSYVSNAAAPPASLRDQHLARLSPGARGRETAAVFAAVCDLILAGALDPQGLPWSDGSLRTAAKQLAAERQIALQPDALQEIVLSGLLVADRALRHETLEWVAAFCAKHGKSLRLHGAGWEKHPTLGRFAAGPAQQGAEIQAITLASRINLQIIGTGVLHPRFLDGVAGGGFFMFRQAPGDRGDSALAAHIECVSRYVFEQGIETFAALEQVSDEPVQQAWEAIRETYRLQFARTGLSEKTTLRGLATAHQVRHPVLLIPQLDDIAFDSSGGFADKARTFLDDAQRREEVTRGIREAVQRHFSYDFRLEQFLTHIRGALADA